MFQSNSWSTFTSPWDRSLLLPFQCCYCCQSVTGPKMPFQISTPNHSTDVSMSNRSTVPYQLCLSASILCPDSVACHCLLCVASICTQVLQLHELTCTCMQGARTCYFSAIDCTEAGVQESGHHASVNNMPASSLFALENTIQQRVDNHQQSTGETFLLHGRTPIQAKHST